MEKIIVKTFEFTDALEKSSKFITKKSSVKAIEYVLLTVRDDTLELRGTTLERHAKTTISADTSEGNGVSFCLLDVKSLLKAFRFFEDGTTTINYYPENIIRITCGNKKLEQKVGPANEFPQMPELGDPTNELTYTADKLKERFKAVEYVATVSEDKPILEGVLFNFTDIATIDENRIAVNTDENLFVENRFTVPATSLKLAAEVLSGEISIRTDKKFVKFTDELGTSVMIRLLEGKSFDYKKIIRGSSETTAMIDIKEFTKGLKYLKTFCNGGEPPVILTPYGISVRTLNGAYESELYIILDGEMKREIGFDVNYMLDLLGQFNGDNINLGIGWGVHHSRSIQVTSPEDTANMAILMPIKLKAEE